MARRCLVLVASVCGLPQSASAADASAHVVIVGPAASPLVRRLREETEALGFSVDLEPDDLRPLDARLAASNRVAAMRLLEQPSESLELVIADPKLHRLFHEELPIRATSDPTSAEVVATRAIELLRAIRLGVPPSPESAVATRLPSEAQATESPKPTTSLSLSPLLNFSPHFQLGTSADVSASYVPRRFGIDVGLVLPITPQRLTHAGGDLDASVQTIHGAFVARTSPRAPLGLRLGIGVEGSRVRFEGMAPAPLVNAGATVLTYGPRFELVAALRIAPHLQLIAPFAASYVLPHTVIRFAGRQLQDWGPLLLRFGLGLEWYWP